MLEAFKKGVKIGIGLSVLTKEKLEKMAKGVAKKGKLPNKKVKETVSLLMKEVKKEKKKFDSLIDKNTRVVLKDLGYVSKKEAVLFMEKMKKLQASVEKNAQAKGKDVKAKVKKHSALAKKKALNATKKKLNQSLRACAAKLK